MGTKQSFSEKVQAELDLINLHLKLASMEASEDLGKAKRKMKSSVNELKDFIDSLHEKKEAEEVKDTVTKVRTKAEVIESIIELENERLAKEEKEIDTEASQAVDDFSSSVQELFDNSELGKLRDEFKNKFDNKLFELNKYLLYQEKYEKLKETENKDEIDAWVIELKNKKSELEQNEE